MGWMSKRMCCSWTRMMTRMRRREYARLPAPRSAETFRPIPNLKIPTLPTPYLAYRHDGTAISSGSKHRTDRAVAGKPAIPATFELDDRPYVKELSKRQKAAQPRKATVSEQWATIPAPKRDDLPQMKRDYQALALATSLDPKRFMKGGTKLTKVPETFAVSTPS